MILKVKTPLNLFDFRYLIKDFNDKGSNNLKSLFSIQNCHTCVGCFRKRKRVQEEYECFEILEK